MAAAGDALITRRELVRWKMSREKYLQLQGSMIFFMRCSPTDDSRAQPGYILCLVLGLLVSPLVLDDNALPSFALEDSCPEYGSGGATNIELGSPSARVVPAVEVPPPKSTGLRSWSVTRKNSCVGATPQRQGMISRLPRGSSGPATKGRWSGSLLHAPGPSPESYRSGATASAGPKLGSKFLIEKPVRRCACCQSD